MQDASEREVSEIGRKFSEDFAFKLRVAQDEEEKDDKLKSPLPEAEDGGDEEEEEFSFSRAFSGVPPISADRPVFPLFNRDLLFSGEESGGEGTLRPLLRKVFVVGEEGDSLDESERPYGKSNGKRPQPAVVEEASPEACKKSNSTGSSKLWRFRELVLRSNSDGKDAFVILNHPNNNNNNNDEKNLVVEKRSDKKEKKKKKDTTPHLAHYARNMATKEGNKRSSYLPYRRDLVGFFADVKGLSKNVHPF